MLLILIKVPTVTMVETSGSWLDWDRASQAGRCNAD